MQKDGGCWSVKITICVKSSVLEMCSCIASFVLAALPYLQFIAVALSIVAAIKAIRAEKK